MRLCSRRTTFHIIILQKIHNEYNENNIAISPYGALSVLIALGEGLEGDAVYEIQQATHIPNDISVIRVGLRDIHRHLKSYFIPKEGFLAGMTLNHENVTLRPEYEEILRFYGYDTATFNNALYPQPETTSKPQTTSGEITTAETQTLTPVARTEAMDVTTQAVTASTIPLETTTSKTIATTVSVDTTTNVEDTTVVPSLETTRLIQTTLPSKEEIPPVTVESTIANTVTSTLGPQESTSEMDGIKLVTTTTKQISTTQAIPTEATTFEYSTVESLEAGSPTLPTEFSATHNTPPGTSLVPTTQTSSSLLPDTTTPTSVDTTLNDVTRNENESTLYTSPSEITSTIASTSPDVVTSSMTTFNAEADSSTAKDNKDNEIDSTVSPVDSVGFGGVSKRKARSKSNQTNVIELNQPKELLGNNYVSGSRRNSRSVVDYFIARYYDDRINFHNNHRPYAQEDEPSFLIYGKYREFNINFMKYDTVLPFHYEPHLDALALSFPLDSSKYYLLLLLPVDETGIDKLVCDLRFNGSIKYIIENLRYTHVVATIPSFTLKGYVTLTPSFQKLGIRKVFEPRQADFAPMTNQRGIYVTNIEQAITVTIRNYVDPENIQSNRNMHRLDPVHFKADHPFLYFVIDSDIHVTLMAGKIVNPLNSRIS
ncbi:hypothetical protein NQ315_003445 [Exocentrus adspersus]|uniref:Serpin domain-containing protein n=1 Tax=Exocentrus adspersus TaxID=1586481 RepID=A0AAV8VMQ9_9CUCU|nr:hypothetical protein NQ315_003445 [Exocentrus adspersus]